MRWSSLVTFVLLGLALAAAQTPAPRSGSTRGGSLDRAWWHDDRSHDQSVRFHIVVEHCDMTGGYITLDGGQSWRLFHLRTVIEHFAFVPAIPR